MTPSISSTNLTISMMTPKQQHSALNVAVLIVFYTECHYAEYHFAGCRYVQCRGVNV
jgi:hypothetical protein